MNRAAEVGGKNNLTRTVKNYAGTVVQHANQAVVEGAKIFQDRISVRNPNSFKLAVRRLEEVALSVRGMERVQALRRWLVAIREIDKDRKSSVHIGERNNEQVHISDDGSASPRKASLVIFYDPDNGDEPMNFHDVFLHSQALENIATSMILEAPSDDEVSLLLGLFELCLIGGKEVHNAIISCMQDLAKAFSSYQEEVLVKRDELLYFARAAITGLKLNAELSRIDGEVLDLKRQLMENKLVDSGRDDLSNVPQRKSNEVSPSTLEDLKKSQEAIRISSRLQFLLERKKVIIHNGDSKEMHAQKVDKLTLLAESLAISTTKAEKQIADNRHQKEETLNYRVAKSHEVEQIEKELATEIQGLEKKRAELEAELKNVNAALAVAKGRRINIQEEREQFDEANVQIISHLKLKEDELVRSVAALKTEGSVVNAWTNFLEDTWRLQSSQIEQSEHSVEDAMEEVNRQFLQFVISNLSTYKEDLQLLLEQIKGCIKALNDLSNERSQVDESNDSEASEFFQQRRKVEENYLTLESQAIAILSTVDGMKAEFYAHDGSNFRNAEEAGKVVESFGWVDQIRQELETIQRPTLELEPVTPKENNPSSEGKTLEHLKEKHESFHPVEGTEQLPRSANEYDGAVKSSGILDAEAELAKLESEFGKTGGRYSSEEISAWEFDELEKEFRSSLSKDV